MIQAGVLPDGEERAHRPALGSPQPYTTRVTREFTAAPAHMAHGSSVANSVVPCRRQVPSRFDAFA